MLASSEKSVRSSQLLNKPEILSVKDLSASLDGNEILRRINFSLKEGEVLALFGPNGVGKSTLLRVLMGIGPYKVGGEVLFKGRDLLQLPPFERAKLGLGLAFQGLPKFKGLRLITVAEEIARRFNQPKERIRELASQLGIENLLEREVGRGFSGGQVKRAELMLTLLQDPDLAMIDEPDSGVDLDGIKVIGKVLNDFLQRNEPQPKRKKSAIVITHNGAILEWLKADMGMVIINGVSLCYQNPVYILDMISSKGYEECLRCLNN